ncbi:chromosomal replication initiator protein DnaA [Verrucomicrobia bacterium IMCC26134]|nr:chromosomal replication initiator protein DnaA [Verrucomicrobia bacterium IMCC26134]
MLVTSVSPGLWESAKADLRGLFPEDVFKLWFDPIVCVEATPEQMTLGVPNDFAAIWINDNYIDLIQQRLRLTSGREMAVKLRKIAADSSAGTLLSTPRPRPAAPRRVIRVEDRPIQNSSLNPRNTFETFVVGDNNQMAAAAARAVADAPGQSYNPLFLYGETGLGKTHLMHAIGHAVLQRRPDTRVAYLSAEKFTNDFIQAIQENGLIKFRQRYRHVDVLLIDDIQFLAGKERSQEEFFHTFNDLHGTGKQIVISSDRRASEIEKLEARLVSRFEWGLPADIQPPDFETRLAILRTKAAAMKCDLPAPIAAFIAQHISRNIRRLEGALLKVASHTQLTGKPLDLPAVEMLLKDVLMEQAQNQLTLEVIQKRVADHFQIRYSDMTSKRRPNNIAIPRQIAMYLTRTLIAKHSLQDIGDAFGGRDHGTVIHACKAVDNMIAQDAHMRGQIEFLRNALSR